MRWPSDDWFDRRGKLMWLLVGLLVLAGFINKGIEYLTK
jgi:hypothetical protein